MVAQSLHEAYNSPILTTIDTDTVKRVPFPSITVDGGRVLNPWGYIEKLLDNFVVDCYQDPTVCTYTNRLKEDFLFLFEPTVTKFTEGLQKDYDDKDLEQLKRLIEVVECTLKEVISVHLIDFD